MPVQSGDIDSAGVSIASDQDIPPDTQVQFLSPKSAKSNDDSLTYSEDSDTTRIYNLNTRETQIVPPTGDERVETPIESPVKLATQFFSSPRKFQAIRRMDDDITTVIRTSNHNLLNGASVSAQLTAKSLANALNGKSPLQDHVVQETYEEKQVIEPEVIDNLPSVKKLAEIYAKEKPVEVQLNKPKVMHQALDVECHCFAHFSIPRERTICQWHHWTCDVIDKRFD